MSVLKLTAASSGILFFLVLADALFDWGRLAGASISVLSFMMAAALFFLLIKRVYIPFKQVESVLKKASDGDLSARLNVKTRDEFGTLAAHINKTVRLLKESGVRQKDLLRALPEAAIEIDENGRVAYMNEAALRLTGYGASEASKMDFPDLAPDESRSAIKDLFKTVAGGHAASCRVIPVVSKDGRNFLVEFVAIPLWRGGATAGCVLIGRDVGEIKRLEEELKNSRLEAEDSAGKLNKMIKDLDEFSVMTVRREQKMREIRERLMELKKDRVPKKDSLDRSA